MMMPFHSMKKRSRAFFSIAAPTNQRTVNLTKRAIGSKPPTATVQLSTNRKNAIRVSRNRVLFIKFKLELCSCRVSHPANCRVTWGKRPLLEMTSVLPIYLHQHLKNLHVCNKLLCYVYNDRISYAQWQNVNRKPTLNSRSQNVATFVMWGKAPRGLSSHITIPSESLE